MSDLDTLRPDVRAAIRTMRGEACGNRDDAYDVIEAELLRLADENAALQKAAARGALAHMKTQRAHRHCDQCGCTWLDDGLNPITCPYCEIAMLKAKRADAHADDIHTCSYFCDRPSCVKRQRDELRERVASLTARQTGWAVDGAIT